MKISIAGMGVTGKALKTIIPHEVIEYDPPLGLNGDIGSADIVFICVPVPTRDFVDGYSQDYSILESVLTKISPGTMIFIRSTVLPGTADRYGAVAFPEFLSEDTALEDIKNMPNIVGQKGVFTYYQVFGKKPDLSCSNSECEMIKYFHNCNGALLINFANQVYKKCKDLDMRYGWVRKGVNMLDRKISDYNTVPHKGTLGYGGTCFPKDMRAMCGFMKLTGNLMSTILWNEKLRKRYNDLISSDKSS